jgi:hypothetical protein
LYDVPANQYLTAHTPGDFDGDGAVDGGDLVRWQGDFALNGESDMNLDGHSDGADFLAWQRTLGNGAPAAPETKTIPEPSAVGLLVLAIAGVRAWRRDS